MVRLIKPECCLKAQVCDHFDFFEAVDSSYPTHWQPGWVMFFHSSPPYPINVTFCPFCGIHLELPTQERLDLRRFEVEATKEIVDGSQVSQSESLVGGSSPQDG